MQVFQDPRGFWSTMGYTYKFYLIVTSVLFLFSLISPFLCIYMIDMPILTIWDFQLWRLFFPYLALIPTLRSVINLLFSFLWISKFFKEKQYSSVYIFWEMFVLNLEIHLVFNLISVLFILIFEQSTFGYGWFPIIIVLQFRQAQTDPQGSTRFCCLPFLIKKKYFPYILIALLTILGAQPFCILAAGLVGYFQEIVRKSNFIKLPFKFYSGFEKILPSGITSQPGFVSIRQVESTVRIHSCGGGGSASQRNRNQRQSQASTFANPFRSGNAESEDNQQNQEKIQGKGVQINSSSKNQSTFKQHWAFKEQKQNKNSNDDIQIEPERAYQSHNNVSKNKSKNTGQHEGYQQFMDQSSYKEDQTPGIVQYIPKIQDDQDKNDKEDEENQDDEYYAKNKNNDLV